MEVRNEIDGRGFMTHFDDMVYVLCISWIADIWQFRTNAVYVQQGKYWVL